MSSTSARTTLPERISEALLHAGVERGAGVLVAVSGGADSTALLAGLRECAELDLRLVAVHVVHGLRSREEGERDVRFLEELAAKLELELVVAPVEEGWIESAARAEGRSLEEVAREERYLRLRRVAAERGLAWIAVAHTLDDQLETVLMRLFQGGLLRGLSGIPRRRGAVIRPLLRCTRREVVSYLAARGLRYRADSTNTDERYLRNRVRRRLVPIVLRLFPSSLDAIETFTGQVAALNEILDACATSMLPWQPEGTGFSVSAESFFRAPGDIRLRSVLGLFNRTGQAGRIPSRFLAPLEHAQSRRPRGCILRGFGALVEQVDDRVFFRPDVVQNGKRSYLIRVFEPTMYQITSTFSFTVSMVPKGSTGDHGISLPETFVRHPLVVRSRRPGDTIQMHDGEKSLKKLFNEWGVRESLRDLVPVVEDRGGIWAVGGSVFGYADRLRYRSTAADPIQSCEEMIAIAFNYSGDEV